MANDLLTTQQITRAAVKLFVNANSFIQNIDRQYDSQFAKEGAKIGTSLRIRLPNDYTVATGPGISVQDTDEQSTTLAVATQKHVDVAFTSIDRTMSLEDISERVLMPMMNNLAGGVASDIMSGSEGGVCNYVSNMPVATILHPTSETFLSAQAMLNDNSAPMGSRKIVNDPWTEARTVSALSGLFNPATKISEQYSSGKMKNALGFDWFMDQTVIKHTTGSFTAGTVSGGSQTGTTLVTNAITGTLNEGDIITLDAVYAVNRVTKETTGMLRQFVVIADAATAAVSLSIYPAITPAVAGVAVQYQTVDASPINGAAIDLVPPPDTTYRQSVAFAPEMVTMATADLIMPRGVHEAAREQYDGIAMRLVTDYAIGTDQLITRIDVLYGYLYVRPEWGVIVADAVN